MLYRKAYQQLKHWREHSQGKTALLVEGARRVGKSTLVRQFCEQEYKSFIFIDFNQVDHAFIDLFEQNFSNLDALFATLSFYFNTELIERQSCIVFDEVQMYPRARTLIKYLVEDGRYDFIETGSLISIHKNTKDIVIPSEEESIRLNPLDFEEFLMALGEERYLDLMKDYFAKLKPLPEVFHKDLMYKFREYMMVGGMPQAVQAYVKSKDFYEVDRIHRGILKLYQEDIVKHTNQFEDKVRLIYETIPTALSHGDKQFHPSKVKENYRAQSLEGALFWLSDAHLVLPCFNSTDPVGSLRMSLDYARYKLYYADTGLFLSQLLLDNEDNPHEMFVDVLKGKLSMNNGALVENIIAQTLVAQGHQLYFNRSYDSGLKKSFELDFIIRRPFKDAHNRMRISAIEVKSAKQFRTASLNRFMKRYEKEVGFAYVISPNNLSRDGKFVYVPLYLAHLL